MRIAICDDELRYRRMIHEKLLQDSICHDYEAEISEYASGAELLAAMERGYSADVFFLDIQMEGGDEGIRLGRALRRRGVDGLIVYITGFIDYVQIGYEVKAFRYLLKSQIAEGLPKVLGDIRQELSGSSYLFQAGGESLRVDKRDILYLESRIRILRLVTAEREYSFYDSLDHAQQELGESFLRCHRSFLVNIDRIRRYSSSEIVLEGDVPIPVSRSYGKAVRQRLMLEMK
ncbi:MAG: response regulator transcription factor [Lachnospiraceae bacterium]|uniref:LytR/AlgR family response regulator transcription factor n=1 Tax=uncultured Acetatifactor sp. TaxID=1671927 RepID=UPI00261E5CB0|nr:LytTR family DNA-binding domain-containing protein [uncultured Acetatifactor sp.]MCI8790298.1 response regulator transcription factor [Lachnospiraceae bacterium]